MSLADFPEIVPVKLSESVSLAPERIEAQRQGSSNRYTFVGCSKFWITGTRRKL